jgi:RimJ/RimL family protein N-acetyltransferase
VPDDDDHVRRPHADEYLAWATLADGLRVAARFQRPEDAEALVGGFEHLSESSLARRFLGAKTRLTSADLDQLVGSVDQVDHVALMLFWRRREHDVLIGEGRFIRLPEQPEDAEVAVTIADEAQGMGAARFLTRILADLALERGVERFVADLLPYNEAARRLVCSVGEVEEDYIEDATRHLAVRIRPSSTPYADASS